LISPAFANVVQSTVGSWISNQPSYAEACKVLDEPERLSQEVSADLKAAFEDSTQQDFHAFSAEAWASPYVLLPQAFVAEQLPATPLDFLPIPSCAGTLMARLSAIAALGALGMETVSYGSENNGDLFVNLVALPGDTRMANKSRGAMRGHTDAVSFPFRGQTDATNPDIAPSPDFVSLCGLRNPDTIPTTVMPLAEALAELTPEQVAELKKQQFGIRSQKTFIPGMKVLLGYEHSVEDGELLLDVDGKTWIRYSHSSVDVDVENAAATAANNALVAACAQHCKTVSIQPGDVLLVNNRLALHGRSEVGGQHGGESRWLLRTYGLDTRGLTKGQRYAHPPYMLVP